MVPWFQLHVWSFDATCYRKLPGLILQIGSDPHKIRRQTWIGGCLCHFQQHRSCQTCVEPICRHRTSSVLFAQHGNTDSVPEPRYNFLLRLFSRAKKLVWMRGHARPSHGTLPGFAGLVGQPCVIRPWIGTGGGCNDCNENRGAGHRLLRRHRAVRCLPAAGPLPAQVAMAP